MKIELDWLKKSCCLGLDERRAMIELGHPELSVARQCSLLDISRSGLYYVPVGPNGEDLELMRLLDEQHTRTPFYGARKMTKWLNGLGATANVKRVRRLLREMGIEAIYRKPRLSLGGPDHRKFPYLLRGVPIRRVNQVWSTDITYIRLRQGFVYLVAILDWYGTSRVQSTNHQPRRRQGSDRGQLNTHRDCPSYRILEYHRRRQLRNPRVHRSMRSRA